MGDIDRIEFIVKDDGIYHKDRCIHSLIKSNSHRLPRNVDITVGDVIIYSDCDGNVMPCTVLRLQNDNDVWKVHALVLTPNFGVHERDIWQMGILILWKYGAMKI